MTLETWNTLLQVASAALLGLTFLVGTGAIWTSYRLGQRQEERIASANQSAAAASAEAARLNNRAAQAELQLAELQRLQGPRQFAATAVAEALKNGPTGSAEVIFAEEVTGESYAFAWQVMNALTLGGWTVKLTAWSPTVNEWEYVAQTSRSTPESGLWLGDKRPEGIQIVNTGHGRIPGPAVDALKDAFKLAGIGIGLGVEGSLAENEVRVMVGYKP